MAKIKGNRTVKFDAETINLEETKFERIKVNATQRVDIDPPAKPGHLLSLTADELTVRLHQTTDREEKKLIKQLLSKK